MKTVIIITVCSTVYLAIGFGILVLKASRDWIDKEDTVLALLFWPVVLFACIFYYAAEGIKDKAQKLGFKLAKRLKK
jgi:hypothetical protein